MVLRTSLNIIPILVALQLLKSPTLSIDLVSTAENLQTTGEMLCWSCQGNFEKFPTPHNEESIKDKASQMNGCVVSKGL